MAKSFHIQVAFKKKWIYLDYSLKALMNNLLSLSGKLASLEIF